MAKQRIKRTVGLKKTVLIRKKKGDKVSMTPKQDDPVVPPPKPGDKVKMTPKQDDPIRPPLKKAKGVSDAPRDDMPVKLPTPGGTRPVRAKKEDPAKLPTPGGIRPARKKRKSAKSGRIRKGTPGIVSSLVKLNQNKGKAEKLPKIKLPHPTAEPKNLTNSQKNGLLSAAQAMYNLPKLVTNAKPSSYTLTPDSPVIKGVARLSGYHIYGFLGSNPTGLYIFQERGYLDILLLDLIPERVYIITLDINGPISNRYSAMPLDGSTTTGIAAQNNKISLVFLTKSKVTTVIFWEETNNFWNFSKAEIMFYKPE